MYNIAQALCAAEAPEVQHELDAVRREIVDQVSRNRPVVEPSPGVFTPLPKKIKQCDWTDFQLTPEITISPLVAGHLVPRDLVNRLLKLHRMQVSVVTSLIRG